MEARCRHWVTSKFVGGRSHTPRESSQPPRDERIRLSTFTGAGVKPPGRLVLELRCTTEERSPLVSGIVNSLGPSSGRGSAGLKPGSRVHTARASPAGIRVCHSSMRPSASGSSVVCVQVAVRGGDRSSR